MNKKDSGIVELLEAPPLELDAEAILADITHYFSRMLGRRTVQSHSPTLYQAAVYATRDRLMERWARTQMSLQRNGDRRAYYLSLEFLMGRLLRNALLSLDIKDATVQALEQIGVDLEELYEFEHDAGLGNGGLGRLAACFLDSCATLGLPVMGYGIRYQYGMFHQHISDGYQVEEPDPWLRDEFPWEIKRTELARTVKFGGRTESSKDSQGRSHYRWVDTHDVLAIPYDIPIPGYRNNVVNTLRLWSAAATDEFDLEEFNAGSYTDAVAAKNAAENITMVLYPNADSAKGQELRLQQEYFLVSASLQDVLADWIRSHGADFSGFAGKHCFQLNDTHPAMAVPELMRLLMDEHELSWSRAWKITGKCMAYTNHTLLPEALEKWPLALFRRLLPRLLDIIVEIDRRFLARVRQRWPGEPERCSRMSLIEQAHEPLLRMAQLAIVGSHSVNGVAELHTHLIKTELFSDFSELWPNKFNNKTNGVTQRRWLVSCNPGLSQLISSRIGEGWITDLKQLKQLAFHADDERFQQAWRRIKQENKERLAALIKTRNGLGIDPESLFDVQVKRIHEYKRQLLNVLHAIHLYDCIKRGEGADLTPRTIIIGGKAAPGYVMAKNIIKGINNVAAVINADEQTQGRLRLVFFPNYNVSAMEMICPAADLSAQISTAGKEASGTGNMKFMMNGAVTIGTLDGANIEIREAVGEDCFFLFGHSVEEINGLRSGYDPAAIIAADEDLSRVMNLLETGVFNRQEPGVMDALLASVISPHDPWMTAADFRSFLTAHEAAGQAYRDQSHWTAMSIRNVAASGRFSTDRTVSEYNRDIWKLLPVEWRD